MKELHNCMKHDEMRKLQKTFKKRRKWLKKGQRGQEGIHVSKKIHCS